MTGAGPAYARDRNLEGSRSGSSAPTDRTVARSAEGDHAGSRFAAAINAVVKGASIAEAARIHGVGSEALRSRLRRRRRRVSTAVAATPVEAPLGTLLNGTLQSAPLGMVPELALSVRHAREDATLSLERVEIVENAVRRLTDDRDLLRAQVGELTGAVARSIRLTLRLLHRTGGEAES